MPIVMPPIPEDVRDCFVEGVCDELWEDGALVGAVAKFPERVDGVSIYSLGLQQIEDGEWVRDGAGAGWRVYWTAGGRAVIGDVRIGASGKVSLASVHSGPRALEAVGKIDAKRNQPGLRDLQYTFCLLRIPGVSLELCWYKPLASGEHYFYSSQDGVKEIERKRIYEGENLYEIVKRLAPLAREFDRLEPA